MWPKESINFAWLHNTNVTTFPSLIEHVFCQLKYFIFPGRLTCCRQHARNKGSHSVTMLKTWVLTKDWVMHSQAIYMYLHWAANEWSYFSEYQSDQLQGLKVTAPEERWENNTIDGKSLHSLQNWYLYATRFCYTKVVRKIKSVKSISHEYFFLNAKSKALKQKRWLRVQNKISGSCH